MSISSSHLSLVTTPHNVAFTIWRRRRRAATAAFPRIRGAQRPQFPRHHRMSLRSSPTTWKRQTRPSHGQGNFRRWRSSMAMYRKPNPGCLQHNKREVVQDQKLKGINHFAYERQFEPASGRRSCVGWQKPVSQALARQKDTHCLRPRLHRYQPIKLLYKFLQSHLPNASEATSL